MALQTPRQRGLQRPSYGGTNNISPSLSASTSAAVNRKASLQALTGHADPSTPSGFNGDGDLNVGDAVNVPGDMYGVAKFIGSVRGKNGVFVGVELDREFAARGKNSGDVDGVSYFTTSIPGAGIFLPVHRAERRDSPNLSPSLSKASPSMPYTPSHSTMNGYRTNTPPRSSQVHKFAQSVGPGVRPSSPTFKPSRPSLPRPESPFRKQPPNLAPTPARPLSASQRGVRPGQTPSKTNLRASTRQPASQTPRPYSRTGSRLGSRGEDSIAEDERTPVGIASTSNARATSSGSNVPSFSQPLRSPSRLGSAGGSEQEVQRLKNLLLERDQRLEEQAATLADMEKSVKELSAIIPQDAASAAAMSFGNEHDDATATQLRQIVREKNEKISMLTAEFDGHRADFRSTLDSLEMASTETERVYEQQKQDLLARNAELEELTQGTEDFEAVARQLKQLEELVAELEEGLEESRRGEAEARGEVEFLRGEVERGRSELRREREKAAAVARGSDVAGAGLSTSRELEQKDDEIRGLKAIIHGLSSNSPGAAAAAAATAAPSDSSALGSSDSAAAEVKRLQQRLADSQRKREDLERELEQTRRDNAASNDLPNGTGIGTAHTRNESERTATGPTSSSNTARPRAETIRPAPLNLAFRRQRGTGPTADETSAAAAAPPQASSAAADSGALFCEMCEATDHDTLDCRQIHGERDDNETETYSEAASSTFPHRGVSPAAARPQPSYHSPGGPGKENEDLSVAGGGPGNAGINGKTGSAGGVVTGNGDEEKWCALCEQDGHLAFDCPNENY